MQLLNAMQTRIVNLCKSKDITLHKLATLSNLTPSTLFSLYYGDSKDFKLSTILRLCGGLNMTLTEFFNDPIFENAKYKE